MRPAQAYARAGVDLDSAARAKEAIKGLARSTFGPRVLTDLGTFAGLFALGRYREPVLAASADGVGTKLKIAFALGRHNTVGRDLVNHCVNDLITTGAEPLFFLDYLALGKIEQDVVAQVLEGVAAACREAGMALLGGETAQMPDFYAPGEYDLAGFIIGAAEKDSVLDGRAVRAGDVLLGLPSSGLHTNGYSLVRAIFELDKDARSKLEAFYPELGRTLGEELLEVHRPYYSSLKPFLPKIKALAHITGGGLIENVPRVLPPGLAARFQAGSWPIPPIFTLILEKGGISWEEMYRVFNMGLGMVIIASPPDAATIQAALPEARVVGEVVPSDTARVIIG